MNWAFFTIGPFLFSFYYYYYSFSTLLFFLNFIILSQLYYSFLTFSKRFINGPEGNAKRLKSLIQPFILRRRKADVIEELPDKTEIWHTVDFTQEETIAYEALRQRAEKSIADATQVNVSVLSEITRLRQAACSLSLVDKNWSGSNSKINAAIELISQIVDSGNRLLVFSQFTTFLNKVKDAYNEQSQQPSESFYLDGSTPVKKRAELVEQFQHGMGTVFFISLKAGGLGLNLTGANYVVHLDPWWNPAIEEQATDRTHRIGQKQNVTVYHLLSEHTIEEKILRLHKTKKDMADMLMEGTDVSRALSMKELQELVSSYDD